MAKQYVAVTVEETYINTYMLPSINDEGAYLGVTIERIAEEGIMVPGFRKRTHISEVLSWEHSPFSDIDLATLANEIEDDINPGDEPEPATVAGWSIDDVIAVMQERSHGGEPNMETAKKVFALMEEKWDASVEGWMLIELFLDEVLEAKYG